MAKKRIGEVLLERGLLTKEKLSAALYEQSVTKERIGKILVRNGFVRQDDILKVLREINPNALHDEAVFKSIVPPDVLLETRSMISAQVEDTLYLATLSSSAVVRKKLAPYIQGYKLVFTGANPVRLASYANQLVGVGQPTEMSWEKLFTDAMRTKCSDIHIIPRNSSFTVMVRRDGVLHLAHEGTMDEYISLVARVKDLARMDMAERRRPQDGGFSMDYSGRIISFRVATVPTIDGEKMVVRILDPDSVNLTLDQLGITRIDEWRRAVGLSDGLCLICGPTGSGKTTTLSSTVREMNFLERAVYTAEDPVEYRIPYAGQVNINKAADLDFSNAVRTFMRADPDVILVGEIRDLETARNALKASETGHLVIATMHTNSVLTTIDRLKHIGVDPHELRHLLRGVMVQRLMRIFCKECGGKGCEVCGHTGYKGREVVSEVAFFRGEHDVAQVIHGKVSWPTLLEDAVGKVRSGRTSEQELHRVFGVTMEDAEAVIAEMHE